MRTPVMRLVSSGLVLFLAIGCGTDDSAAVGETEPSSQSSTGVASPFSDGEVQRLHDRMMGAMDPDGMYERQRYLAFDWSVQFGDREPVTHQHRWDRWSGDVRVEGPTDEGRLVASFNLGDVAAGRAWLDGTPVSETDRIAWVERAHGMHVNDAYWLVMPFKWRDPGVVARSLGERTDDEGRRWDVVELGFEGVGLTPQNLYHAYLNPESGLMERWAHFRTADADAFFSDWTDWQDVGGVRMPLDRPWANGGRIWFEDVDLSETVPPGAFEGPTG